MKVRNDYWNDIKTGHLGKFCATMRDLCFDPKEFIDEDGYWKVSDYSKYRNKLLPESEIRRINNRTDYENEVFKDMVRFWENTLNHGVNPSLKRYFNYTEVMLIGRVYLRKFIDYDAFCDANLEDSEKSDLLRFFGFGRKNVLLYNDWSEARKHCIARLFRKAFAYTILKNTEEGKEPKDFESEDEIDIDCLCWNICDKGEFIDVYGKFSIDGKIQEYQPIEDSYSYCSFIDENGNSHFRYMMDDISSRYRVVRQYNDKSVREGGYPPFISMN